MFVCACVCECACRCVRDLVRNGSRARGWSSGEWLQHGEAVWLSSAPLYTTTAQLCREKGENIAKQGGGSS